MYYLISLIWNWFPSTWLWKRHFKNILRFNLSLTFYRRKLILIHKEHDHPDPLLKARAPCSGYFLRWFSPVTWDAVQWKGRNCSTEIDGIWQPAFLKLMCFSESHPERKRHRATLACHMVQRWPLKLLLTRVASLQSTSKENSKWGRTEVWKSRGWF